ncbi:MAG TPA: FecR domain-containing protein, partial [Armatimonadota bacterium]|nr:FecR domain-containing protein [Armatimonadota bacterium]
MYRSAVILIVAFVLLLLMLIVVAQTVVVVEMLAVVDERAGTVQVVRGGDSRPAEIGMLVRAGERIRTGAGARVGLHWADGSRVELGPDSEFVIQRCRLNKAKHTRRSSFRLNLGEIWIRVRGALEPGSKFEVETPTIVAAVRGTMFNVKVAPDGTTQLQVYRGEVEISGSDSGATRDVQSGGCAVVSRRGFDLRGMSEAEKQSWQEVGDITGPLLEVMEPAAGTSTSMALAPVRGRTEDGVAVAVNGERVRVGRKGTFRGRARLVEGQNVVTIVATLANLTTSVQREVTYVNPTREIVA